MASILSHHQVDLKETGISLHYVEQGPRTGPTVILCHGWPEFWYSWHKQIPVLAAAEYRVIVPDLRGYGTTRLLPGQTNGREQYTFRKVSSDLVALLDYLSIPHCVLIGHDWGGAFVWSMARRYPKRVVAVGSVCTAYWPRPDAYRPLKEVVEKIPAFAYQLFFAEQRETAATFIEQDLARFFRVMFSKPDPNKQPKVGGVLELLKAQEPTGPCLLSDEELAKYVETFGKTGFKDCLHWYGTGELNFKEDEEDKLPREIHQPALVVTAGQDRVLLPAMTMNMEQWIPKLSRGHIEEAGHWVQAQEPEQLNKILLNWLNSLKLSSSSSIPSKL